MMTRLVWVLLVVCVFAGCGGPKPRTLENLTYAELTELVNIEIAEAEHGEKFFDSIKEKHEYQDRFSEKIQMLQRLRKKRLEEERPRAEKLAPK